MQEENFPNLNPDSGEVVTINGKQVAVYKDSDGNITKVSAICTHVGCEVLWNGKEKTWDCPCHGSRFKVSGEVINGPADEPLEKIQ